MTNSKGGNHLVSTCRWDSTIDNQANAYQLQEVLSGWSHKHLKILLEKEFERYCPADEIWRFKEMEINIGHIDYENIEEELSEKVKESVRLFLKDFSNHKNVKGVVTKNTDGHCLSVKQSNKSILNFIIKNGTAPWWLTQGQSTVQVLNEQALNNVNDFNEIIAKLSSRETLRKRLLWQWGEKGNRQIVKKLEPGHSEKIESFIESLLFLNEKIHVSGIDPAILKSNFWLWVIEFLLDKKSSIFNLKQLSSFIFNRLAESSKENKAELIHQFLQVTTSPTTKKTLQESYLDIDDKPKTNRFLPNLTAVEIMDIDLIGLMNQLLHNRKSYVNVISAVQGRKSTFSFTELIMYLASQNKQQLLTLLKKEGRDKKVREQLLLQLGDEERLKLVEWLEPNNATFIHSHICRSRSVLSEKQKESDIVWEVVLAYLLSDSGSYFNKIMFVKNTLFEISNARSMNYSELLNLVLHSAMSNPGFEHRFELLNIFNDLKREDSVNNKRHSKEYSGYSILMDYLSSGIWPSHVTASLQVDVITDLFKQNNDQQKYVIKELITQVLKRSPALSVDLICKRLLDSIVPSQFKGLLSSMLSESDRFVPQLIHQFCSWQQQGMLSGLNAVDMYFEIYRVSLVIAYEESSLSINMQSFTDKLITKLIQLSSLSSEQQKFELKQCLQNSDINSGESHTVALHIQRYVQNVTFLSGRKEVVDINVSIEDVPDWPLAKLASRMYRILKNSSSVGGMLADHKNVFSQILKHLSKNQYTHLFDSLFADPKNSVLLNQLIHHADLPEIKSWLETHWSVAAGRKKERIDHCQQRLVSQRLWMGSKNELKKQLEYIYWSIVLESQLLNTDVIDTKNTASRAGVILKRETAFDDKFFYVSSQRLNGVLPDSNNDSEFSSISNHDNNQQVSLHMDETYKYLRHPLLPDVLGSLLISGRNPLWLKSHDFLSLKKLVHDLLTHNSSNFMLWVKPCLTNNTALFRLLNALDMQDLLNVVAKQQGEAKELANYQIHILNTIAKCHLSVSQMDMISDSLKPSLVEAWIFPESSKEGKEMVVKKALKGMGERDRLVFSHIKKLLRTHLPEKSEEIRQLFSLNTKSIAEENKTIDKEPMLVTILGSNEKTEEESKETCEIGQSILIKNAGLVIIQSFIQTYFNRLELTTDNDEFKNGFSQRRAAHCLQFLVTGQIETEEHHLMLNKILCGIPLTSPIEKTIELSSQEAEMSESLINAMVGYWSAIGTSSVDGFRGNWLIRDGVLTELGDRWELIVEKRGYDLLLQQAPFSYSIIKFPWMLKPVYVTWYS